MTCLKSVARVLIFITKSLQDAAKTTNIFLKDLKQRKPEKNNINLLLATRELESFALNYGKIHYKANDGEVITQELFGKSLVVIRG